VIAKLADSIGRQRSFSGKGKEEEEEVRNYAARRERSIFRPKRVGIRYDRWTTAVEAATNVSSTS
jgi:hypothetical protein